LVYTFLFTATPSSSSSSSSFFEKEGKRHKKKAIGNVLLTPHLSLSLSLSLSPTAATTTATKKTAHACPARLPTARRAVILFIFYFLFFWRVLASLINMLSAQTNEFFE
jgi:hypothetical protein